MKLSNKKYNIPIRSIIENENLTTKEIDDIESNVVRVINNLPEDDKLKESATKFQNTGKKIIDKISKNKKKIIIGITAVGSTIAISKLAYDGKNSTKDFDKMRKKINNDEFEARKRRIERKERWKREEENLKKSREDLDNYVKGMNDYTDKVRKIKNFDKFDKEEEYRKSMEKYNVKNY